MSRHRVTTRPCRATTQPRRWVLGALASDTRRAGGGAQAEARRGAGRWASWRAGARHCAYDTMLGRLRHGQLGPATQRWAGHDTATRARPGCGLCTLVGPD